MRPGGTPVPIPNTMVKTWAADGTALETMWESRWMPALKWGCSSVGRAPALQAGGQEFESLHLHESNEESFRKRKSRQANALAQMSLYSIYVKGIRRIPVMKKMRSIFESGGNERKPLLLACTLKTKY